ncbi:uncharacterized protein ACMZJ9_006770 [Mantella aurantiaca]
MASRGCLRSADAFCYVCGHFIKTRARKYSVKACRKMCEAYKAYFGMPVGDQDKSWAPHVTCEYCKKTLEGWYRGEKRAMKFAIPRIWREPTDHSNNCYFCMVEPTKRRTGKNVPQIVYPDIPSSIAPVPHCPQLPVPTPPTRDRSSSGDNSKSDSEEDTGDLECDFTDADDEKRPYFPNQKDINDLIRDLGLTKSNAELLTSRLKQWNLLDESVPPPPGPEDTSKFEGLETKDKVDLQILKGLYLVIYGTVYMLKHVQALTEDDKQIRTVFSVDMLGFLENDDFGYRIVFNDETTFNINDKVNRHNVRI